ncbi:MAG: c-type cytochrome [Labilithrix sp.]|nr:c-type cytochrome [Labilithrix sp.]MCW5812518.1 c-type cytochrome [Labilithrix sp.]
MKEEPKPDTVIHEVDGIAEYDNKLPNWWLYTLYGSVVVAVGYWYLYQTTGFGNTPAQAYQEELDRAAAAQAMQLQVGEATPESLTALSRDPNALALGKSVFTATCAACHRNDGGGTVGPNLTDEFWLHGGAPEKVFKTIALGVPDKGMPAWQAQLGALKTQAVTAYVLTLRGTNAAGGKAPQGERETLSAR